MATPSLISKLTRFSLGHPVWQGILLGALGTFGVLGMSPAVQAAESVTLQYEGEIRTFPVRNLEAFVNSGQAQDPEIQAFFERNPELRRLVQELFSVEIYISPTFLDRVEQGAKSPTVDFILIQLNKLISTPSMPEDFQPLRTTIIDSLQDDNRLSLTELIRNYPGSEIQVNLTGLEPVFNDVKAFVERVLPALEVARDFLRDTICDCETPSAQSADDRRSSADSPTVLAATQSVNCRPDQITVQTRPELSQPQAALVESTVDPVQH